MTYFTTCPYCGREVEYDGPEGFIPHVMEQHPTSNMAANITIDLIFGPEAA